MITRPPWLRGIRLRLLLVLVLVTLPILAGALISVVAMRQRGETEVRNAVVQSARQASVHLGLLLDTIHQQMILTAQLVARAGIGQDTGKTILAPALAATPHFISLLVTDVGGTVVAGSAPLSAPVFLGDRPYFIAQRRLGDFTIGDYAIGRTNGRATISFALPLRTVDPHQDGVLVASLDLAWFSRLTDRLDLNDDMLLTVLDAGGTVLFRSLDPYHWIGQKAEEPHVEAMVAGEARPQQWTGPGLDGVVRFFALEPVRLAGENRALGIAVGLAIPAMTERWTSGQILVLLAWVGALAGLYAGVWLVVGRSILRPLGRLRRRVEDLAAGAVPTQGDLEDGSGDFAPVVRGLAGVGNRIQQAQAAADEASTVIRLDLQRLDVVQRIVQQSAGDDGTFADMALSAALSLTGSRSGWLGVVGDDPETVTILAWRPCLAAGASLERSRMVRREALGPLADLLTKGQPLSSPSGLVFTAEVRLAIEQPGWEQGYAAVSSSHHGDGPVLLLAVGDKGRAYAPIEIRQMTLLIDEVRQMFALRRRQLRHDRRMDDMDRGRRIEALARLAGAVAHDFNNQLSAIAGYADLLRRRADQPTFVRDAASRIDHAVFQASQLTNRLRAFSQNGLPGSQPCDLHHLLEQALAIVQPSFGTTVVVSQSLNATRTSTTGDPARLVQALVTLLARARDVMPEGGGLLVATRDAERNGLQDNPDLIGESPGHDGLFLALSIIDHGPVLDENQRQHLFEPFALTSGDGLGLATAYATIRDHGGAIAVTSRADAGTIITVFIPMRVITQPEEHEAATPIPTQTSLRVLVVDNEVSVRAVLVDQLEELGHAVTACDGGLVALDRLRSDPTAFDLAIIDLRMPSLNGAICTERIRELNTGLPVLVCSGSSQDDPLAQEAIRAGAAGFLHKPVRLADLSQAIHEVMRKVRG